METLQKISRGNGQFHQVLLVEDDPFWQDLISRTMRAFYGKDVSVRCAKSFHHADNLIFNNRYDLVICDQLLEGDKTGLDLLTAIREKHLSVPVIMLSSISRDEFLKETDQDAERPIFIEKKQFKLNQLGKLLDSRMHWPRQEINSEVMFPKSEAERSRKSQLKIMIVASIFVGGTIASLSSTFMTSHVRNPDVESKRQIEEKSIDVTENERHVAPAAMMSAGITITPELRMQVKRLVEDADEIIKLTNQMTGTTAESRISR